jgi:sirohydrochlorin cobaltochelatase
VDNISPNPKTGLMFCGHGSRDDGAVREFNALAEQLKQKLPDYDIESGFLEFAPPLLRTGLDKLKERGSERILCLPGMLFAAGHGKNELPREINEFAAKNPNINVHYGRELAIDQRLLKVAAERIEQAEAGAKTTVAREDTLLMVVGHGANDSDANSNVYKVARMLWEGMGFGWAEVSYFADAYPLVDEGLTNAVKLGYERIVIFPYSLFTGILVRRIYDWADEAQNSYPDVEILKAEHLKNHPLLIDTFTARVSEMLSGDNVMNCLLCKYREQVIGNEGDLGKPQDGHHHHVHNNSASGEHPHDHGHGDHGHHHHHGKKET